MLNLLNQIISSIIKLIFYLLVLSFISISIYYFLNNNYTLQHLIINTTANLYRLNSLIILNFFI